MTRRHVAGPDPAAGGRTAATDAAEQSGDGVRRQVLSDGVYAKLKAQLMEHAVEPGARLSIDALARRYQVSPTPVREALARLESDGLVVKRPLVGYSATPPLNLTGFDNLFEMRLLLEPAAAAAAARNVTPGELATIAGIFETMSTADPGSDYARYHKFATQDALFHKAIASASGNSLLAEAIDRLQIHKQFYKDYYYRHGITEQTLSEHREILRAVQQRDAEAAFRAMTDHIERSRSRLRPTSMTASDKDDRHRDRPPARRPGSPRGRTAGRQLPVGASFVGPAVSGWASGLAGRATAGAFGRGGQTPVTGESPGRAGAWSGGSVGAQPTGPAASVTVAVWLWPYWSSQATLTFWPGW